MARYILYFVRRTIGTGSTRSLSVAVIIAATCIARILVTVDKVAATVFIVALKLVVVELGHERVLRDSTFRDFNTRHGLLVVFRPDAAATADAQRSNGWVRS